LGKFRTLDDTWLWPHAYLSARRALRLCRRQCNRKYAVPTS